MEEASTSTGTVNALASGKKTAVAARKRMTGLFKRRTIGEIES